MKWFDWNTNGLPYRISQEPLGYTLSYREHGDEGIVEAWYNAGSDKDPAPVFIGQERGFDRAYRPAKKEAAAKLALACQEHAEGTQRRGALAPDNP